MTTGLRRYEFSERLAEILGESRRDLRFRVTLMITGGIVPPGPRGPGSPPATPDYAAELLIGVMAAPQQALTAEAIRCYRDLRPTALAAEAAAPTVVLGAPGARARTDDPPDLALLPGRPRFGQAVALLLEQARDPETREMLAWELFGLWLSRGVPVAAVQLAAWWEGRRAVVTQRYELPEGGRPPSWLDPDRGGAADPGLFHSVFLPAGKLIEIGTLTAPQDERNPRMLGLGQTTARLARHRRHWEKFLSAAAAADTDARASRLAEVTGFGSNPGNLRMLTYVPDRLPPAAPLVVVLHGCTQSAATYDHASGWSTLADRFGFALVLPEQKRSNNPNGCFTWFESGDIERDRGEALSIRQMVERMIADHGLDRRRVYVTGLSAGGAMTTVMLATYPDVFAGGAILAGLPYRSATNLQEAFDGMFQGRSRSAREWGDLVRAASPHRGPWPKVAVWHGDADTIVAPVNAAELVKQWTDVHGLAPEHTIETTVDGHRYRVWQSPSGEDLVEAYTITGMAHGAPVDLSSGERLGAAAPFSLDVGISSTYHIARFWGLTETRREASAAEDRPPPSPASAPAPDEPPREEPARAASRGAERVGGATARGVDIEAIITQAFETAGLLKTPRGAAPKSRTIDPQAIITQAFEAAGLLKTPRDTAPKSRTIDPQAIITQAFEAAGLLKTPRDVAAESRPVGGPPAGAGWEGDGWQILANDRQQAPGGESLLFGYASSGIGCAGGNKIRSVSRLVSLGDRPRLSYTRKLDLRAAVNIFTTASFSVLVDGVQVDDVSVVGMNYAEAEWTERAGIDLAQFAGRTVTLTFEVAANSNVCMEVFAKAWLTGIDVQDGVMAKT